jgi:hypothetical protein
MQCGNPRNQKPGFPGLRYRSGPGFAVAPWGLARRRTARQSPGPYNPLRAHGRFTHGNLKNLLVEFFTPEEKSVNKTASYFYSELTIELFRN